MKNTREIMKTASIVTVAVTAACLITTIILLILQTLNKIDLGIINLLSFGMGSFLLLGVVFCIESAVIKFIDYKKRKGYEKREQVISSAINLAKQRIRETEEYIEEEFSDVQKRISALEKEISHLDISSIVSEDCDVKLFNDLKGLCIRYLHFMVNLDFALSSAFRKLSQPEYSGYGYYVMIESFNKNEMPEIEKRFFDELSIRYIELEIQYTKCYEKIKCDDVIKSQDGDVKSKIIDLLSPDKYYFVRDLLEYRVYNLNYMIRLARLRQYMVDTQYMLGETSIEKIVEDLTRKEQVGYQTLPTNNVSDPTVVAQQLQQQQETPKRIGNRICL